MAAREAAQTFHSSDSQLRTGSEDPSGDDHPQCVTASWKPPRSASGPGLESNSAVPVCRLSRSGEFAQSEARGLAGAHD